MNAENGKCYTIREGSSEHPKLVQADCHGPAAFPGFYRFKTREKESRTITVHADSVFLPLDMGKRK